MKKTVVLACTALLTVLTGVAYAAQLLSPMLPTSVGTSGACYIRNNGNKAVAVNVSLFSNNGMIINFDNCNGTLLGAGRTCVLLSHDLPDDSYVGCSATAGSVSKIRGTLEVRQIDPVLKVIVSEDLR